MTRSWCLALAIGVAVIGSSGCGDTYQHVDVKTNDSLVVITHSGVYDVLVAMDGFKDGSGPECMADVSIDSADGSHVKLGRIDTNRQGDALQSDLLKDPYLTTGNWTVNVSQPSNLAYTCTWTGYVAGPKGSS